MSPDVDQTAEDFFVGFGLQDLPERRAAAEEIPESEEVVVAGFGGVPETVLAGAVGGDEVHAVEVGVDLG